MFLENGLNICMVKLHKIISLIGLLFIAGNVSAQVTLPRLITIQDLSWSGYTGRFEYSYDLVLKEDKYELVRQFLLEDDYFSHLWAITNGVSPIKRGCLHETASF